MRISVVGSAGSGKTTLARQVAQRVGIRHVELDSLFHLEGWTPNPEFRPQVEAALATPEWVCDGNYSAVTDLVSGNVNPDWPHCARLVWPQLLCVVGG